MSPTRRKFIALVTRGLAVATVAACRPRAATAAPSRSRSSCGPATPPNIEGPFFKPGAPERSRLAPETARSLMVLSGRVTDASCRPIANARLEFWQADHKGAYDNRGYHYRCTTHTDGRGVYRLTTIIPGRYLNGEQYRPAHIHVKVRVPDRPPLTTQLYFPGDPYNKVDPWFDRRLLIAMSRPKSGPRRGHFDFKLD